MDYLNPDYRPILAERGRRLQSLRANPAILPALKAHYRANPVQFVTDWGMTTDPRNIERGLPALVPLVLFPRQLEWAHWILSQWRSGKGGLTEKTRDMGCSVVAMSLFATLCLFERDFVAGVGSRKESLVDKVGDPSTLFFKARVFLRHIPVEFRSGWRDTDSTCNSHMKIWIPGTESTITGEAGDNVGRGGRTSIYLFDEKAHHRNQASIDMSLSQTTRCHIDLSSVAGMNHFGEKRHSGKVDVFTFHWRDDPRKDQAWYDGEVARLPAVIVAQEIDINYNASQENILIPSEWVQAAIDAHLVILGATDGAPIAGLDVADEGADMNALAIRKGIALRYIEEWSGKASDIYATSAKAVLLCDMASTETLRYDADGLGVGVRGDVRVINEGRKRGVINAVAHRGSGSVVNPEQYAIDPDKEGRHQGRTNDDFFMNYKAQSWWALRRRFEKTYAWIKHGRKCDPTECISLPSTLSALAKLSMELSQPTYGAGDGGKIRVNKKPNNSKSPNLADSIVIAYAPEEIKRQLPGVFLPT